MGLVLLPERFLSPVGCVPKPYLCCSLCPIRRQVGVLHSTRQWFPSLNNQPDSKGMDWGKSEPESCWASGSRVGKLDSPALLSLLLLIWGMNTPPLLFLIQSFPNTPKARLEDAASLLLKGLSGACCFPLTQAWEQQQDVRLGLRQVVMGWRLKMIDGGHTSEFLMTPRLQDSLQTVTVAGMPLFLLLPLSSTLIWSWSPCSFFSYC